ncbi:HAMP domain-containing sensor histidine kinase [Streptomyces sp. P1-3]|uniref:HAMP domain-containing sensor histidine kinase n=1 Tax=Streptomyces sp. P1-3 TaxID=3421658 RepID=UPI003D35BD87
MIRWFRRLPLRSRLALLTAAAVALAVAISALACWFVTRDQLVGALDDRLRDDVRRIDLGRLRDYDCTTDSQGSRDLRPGAANVQVVRNDGTPCVAPGSDRVRVTREDVDVAHAPLFTDATHDGTTADGREVRVRTEHVQVNFPDGRTGELTVSVSRPLAEVTRPLDTLALVLLTVAGGGVVLSATAGLWIARTGLKPVDRLTDAVEHVARTEDLAVRIPVEGEDEIARLSRSFNAMTAALASSRDRQQQLIADAGHELRTPLTSLRTNIELLARSEETGRALPPEDRRALLAGVTAQMTELAALIGDLQELSRPDAAPGSGPVQVVALHEVADAALERARLRGAEVTFTAALDPWYVRAEPASLERALVNLLDNAVKFSPPGGTVEVALADGEFTVRDHGPGIREDELPHVFDRFWRSPSARSLPGSGLGLSIVARTVRSVGGEVALRPAPGGGTVARVRLPGAAAPF